MVGSTHTSVRASQLQGSQAAVRGIEDGADDGLGVLMVAHDRGTRDQLFRWRHHENNGDDSNVMNTDSLDLGTVDVETLGGLLELAETVDGRDGDEPVAGAGGNGPFGEADCVVVSACEADPDETAQTRDFRRDVDEHGAV